MSGLVHEHTTREGDRWDLLAWEFYGDAGAFEPIVAANPTVPLYPVFPAGVRLVIPERVDLLDTAATAQELPPWKR